MVKELNLFDGKKRFADEDLVYGPKAVRKLRAFQRLNGGHLLGDRPEENPYTHEFDRVSIVDIHRAKDGDRAWILYSCSEIKRCIQLGRKIHFDLT